MKPSLSSTALLALLALAGAHAFAASNVKFVEPDKFSDMPFPTWEREEVLKELDAHFAKLAKSLPAGQDLKVEVTDIDLAGTDFPGRMGRDVRILKGGADWPRINLKYSIEAQGRTLASGEARVADMNYLRQHNPYPSNESLRYEKRMLDQWFKKDVLGKAKS
jgi:Protein of unknown function (DUF3016)